MSIKSSCLYSRGRRRIASNWSLIRVIAMSFSLFAKYIYVGECFAIVNNGGRLKSSPLLFAIAVIVVHVATNVITS